MQFIFCNKAKLHYFMSLNIDIDRRVALKTYLSYRNIKTEIIGTKMKTRQS